VPIHNVLSHGDGDAIFCKVSAVPAKERGVNDGGIVTLCNGEFLPPHPPRLWNAGFRLPELVPPSDGEALRARRLIAAMPTS